MNSKLAFCILFSLVCYQAVSQDLGSLKKEKWVKVSGGISATTNFYNMQGIEPRRVPFSWITTGNVTATIKGVSLPFYFTYSEQERSIRQPFNQFGVSPTYKWMKFHLGYRNVSFSKYVLDGHIFLGGGAEINPGKLRLGFVYGRFLKGINEDTSKSIVLSTTQFPFAAYDRYGYGIKLGVGTELNYFDLVYFKAKDRVKANQPLPKTQYTQPAENAVLGFKSKFTFFKNHLIFNLDGGISLLTRNILSDSILLGNETVKKFDFIITPNLSTTINYAGQTSLDFKSKFFGTGIKYERVMPDYRSMGIYYMQTDLERQTVNANFNLLKNKILVTGSAGIEHDNLAHKKEAETRRKIYSANVNINPKPIYGLMLQYMNYGLTQFKGVKSISDTTRLNQVTSGFVVIPRYTLIKKNGVHNFIIAYTNQTLNDKNLFNSQNFNFTVENINASYSGSLQKPEISMDASIFNTKSTYSIGNTVNTGLSAGVGKAYLKKKLNTNGSVTFSYNQFNGKTDGNTLQLRLAANYLIKKKQRVNANLNYTINKAKNNVVSKSFNELQAFIMYSITF